MKVVILAGGLGTRIAEYTKTIPKPMIEIEKTYYLSSWTIMRNLVLKTFILLLDTKEM